MIPCVVRTCLFCRWIRSYHNSCSLLQISLEGSRNHVSTSAASLQGTLADLRLNAPSRVFVEGMTSQELLILLPSSRTNEL